MYFARKVICPEKSFCYLDNQNKKLKNKYTFQFVEYFMHISCFYNEAIT